MIVLSRKYSHLDDAISKGAMLVCGGKIDEKLAGKFFKPTILDNVTDEMFVSCDETFGPLIAIFEFASVEEVINEQITPIMV